MKQSLPASEEMNSTIFHVREKKRLIESRTDKRSKGSLFLFNGTNHISPSNTAAKERSSLD